MVKGYTQQEDINYEETFSPIVRFTSIHLILAIVANMDLELHQMDVKMAFLNGELDEEIYIEQPIGFVVKAKSVKYASSKDPFMVLNSYADNGTLDFIKLL